MTRVAIAVALLIATGCHGTFEEAKLAGVDQRRIGAEKPGDPERCARLDNQARAWGAVAKGSAVAAGGAALSNLSAEVRDDKTARISVAGGALAAGVLGAAAVAVSEGAARSWVRECSE